jgi:hypothetical protein
MRDAQQPGERRAARHTVATPVAPARGHVRRSLAAFSVTAVLALLATFTLVPQAPAVTAPNAGGGVPAGDEQSVSVAPGIATAQVARESYVATTGAQTLVAGGTNLDWAKLVLVEGGWPLSEENITFMMRWMRQENGADNWWNRNNPLNNGQGSGGGAGLGSYPTLIEAAYYAAENLQSGRYPAVDAALARGDSADATAQAIWASPWASSHYGYGTHWSSRPYDVIEAPASAWGR